ncbi:MAG: hypothetical protein OEW78_10350 [Nitrosopumilus sp.]|uniref:hypothetical protein n=1 Tax=Nitrosopumilus sp. TaxID=2024843 RepID=UPI00246DCB3F|nr:hypothetical protein [Nitrosopumilus sp.]MDH5432260.1 hypothetical protein [Nitrosopumilus sp.]
MVKQKNIIIFSIATLLLGTISTASGKEIKLFDQENKLLDLIYPYTGVIVLSSVVIVMIVILKTPTKNNPCATDYWEKRNDGDSYTHSSS